MKVCKYCDTVNADNATECTACGAKEFSHKCDNCGTEFDNGMYCPKCGVKVGTRTKTCPACGTKYYTNACPNCGYAVGKGSASTAKTQSTYQEPITPEYEEENITPKKKRKTWLWVLGWIFCFPIPLTVLIVKNKKMSKVVKGILIALLWLAFIFIGSAQDNQNTENTQTTSGIEINVEDVEIELTA